MSEITRHLSYNDINLLKKNIKEELEQNELKNETEKQEEMEPKERHD